MNVFRQEKQIKQLQHTWMIGCLVVVLSVLVSACGFQLRGLTEIPDALKSVYLSSEQSSSTLPILKRLMQSNGIKVEKGAISAPYHLTIVKEEHQRRAVSLSSTAQTEEYELRSTIVFQVVDSAGEMVITPTQIYTERTYRFDENNINAKAAEESLIRQEMYSNLAQQIIRRYRSIANKSPN